MPTSRYSHPQTRTRSYDELGSPHFQEAYPAGTTERYGVEFEEATPRWILSWCLAELPERLADFRGRLEAIQPDD